MHNFILIMFLLSLSLGGCGKAKKGNTNQVPDKELPKLENSPPNQSEEATTHQGNIPGIENQESKNSETSTTQNPSLQSPSAIAPSQEFAWKEIKLELEGDFKIKKVIPDHENNFVLGIVCNLKKSNRAGFVIIKVSTDGKELWRFPTKSNLRQLQSNDRILEGSYFYGDLVDFDINHKSQIAVVGIQKRMSNLKGNNFANHFEQKIPKVKQFFDGVERSSIRGNEIFYWMIESPNNTEKDVKVVYRHIIASPVWWEPLAISFNQQNQVVLSSTSNGEVNDPTPPHEVNTFFVMQEQVFDAELKSVLNSVCYLTPGPFSPVGKNRLSIVQSAAPKWVVDRMTEPVTMELFNYPGGYHASSEKEFEEYNFGASWRNRAKCWDVLKNEIMTESSTSKIQRPLIIEAAQSPVFDVVSIADLLHETGSFRKHSIEDSFVLNKSNLWGSAYSEFISRVNFEIDLNHEFSQTRVALHGTGQDLVYIGYSSIDLFQNQELVVSNLKSYEKDRWYTDLGSNQTRQPSSVSTATLEENNSPSVIYVAWTEIRGDGEHLAGTRRLKLAKVSYSGTLASSKDLFELDAPEELGYTDYSSTRIVLTPQRYLAVFATASHSSNLNPSLVDENHPKKVEPLAASSLWLSYSKPL